MAEWDQISACLFKALAQLDVESMRAEAERRVRLALIGTPGSGKTTLACALADRPLGEGGDQEWLQYLPEYQLPLAAEDVAGLDSAVLLMLLLDATKGDYATEVAAAEYLSFLGKPVLVCYSKMDLLASETRLIRGQARWRGAAILPVCAVHPETVREQLGPAILEALPEHPLPLARHLPLFRGLVADKWIEQTALSNATQASASGLLEAVPMLHMPLHGRELETIGPSLASLVYRLGLAYGLSLDWQQSRAAADLALTAGRWWQQLAHAVLGLIPIWGLESKVALVYAGSIVTGRSVQAWCDTGHMLSQRAFNDVCRSAAAEARSTSRALVAKAREALPVQPPKEKRASPRSAKVRFSDLTKSRKRPACEACGRSNPRDAVFCAYCGARLKQAQAGIGPATMRAGETQAGTDRSEVDTEQ